MAERYDRIVVGAGILGLSHARAALAAGERVAVVEREPRATGATIRNFGMVWPVGMRAGEDRQRALRSREIWLDLSRDAGVEARSDGSMHIARHEDEWAVLQEFVASDASAGLDCELLAPEDASCAHPGLRVEGLVGVMRSTTELAIEPRTAADRIAAWLESQGVTILRSIAAVRCETGSVMLADGRQLLGHSINVCSGADLRVLFPDVYQQVSVSLCKLQMMRLSAPAWRVGAHVAGGLTLGHYAAFEDCPSLAAVRDRYALEHPFFGEHGIHVMSAQRADGTLVIGDSHEYGPGVSPFDREDINDAIVNYLGEMLDLRGTQVIDRWHGVYAKRMDGQTVLRCEPVPGVTVLNCVGGAGMTLGPAIAEEVVRQSRDLAAQEQHA